MLPCPASSRPTAPGGEFREVPRRLCSRFVFRCVGAVVGSCRRSGTAHCQSRVGVKSRHSRQWPALFPDHGLAARRREFTGRTGLRHEHDRRLLDRFQRHQGRRRISNAGRPGGPVRGAALRSASERTSAAAWLHPRRRAGLAAASKRRQRDSRRAPGDQPQHAVVENRRRRDAQLVRARSAGKRGHHDPAAATGHGRAVGGVADDFTRLGGREGGCC